MFLSSLSLSVPHAFILPLVVYLWSDLGSVEDGFVEHRLMMIKCDHGSSEPQRPRVCFHQAALLCYQLVSSADDLVRKLVEVSLNRSIFFSTPSN